LRYEAEGSTIVISIKRAFKWCHKSDYWWLSHFCQKSYSSKYMCIWIFR